jgi:O-acetyl-ADP-ribose deacetylase (regulator of RNase III)
MSKDKDIDIDDFLNLPKKDNTPTPIWEEVDGDLIKLSKTGIYDVIAHGCNCQKNFGAGIALGIKKAYPLAYQNDLDTPSPMGDITVCKDYTEVDIVNAYTQYYPGKGGHGKDTKYHRYASIRSVMAKIDHLYHKKHVALPLLGCGLAGLKWSKVRKIIKEELKSVAKITIVHYVK